MLSKREFASFRVSRDARILEQITVVALQQQEKFHDLAR